MPLKPQYMVFSHTATDDNPFNISTLELWMIEADVSIYTAAATMGTTTLQDVALAANSVKTIKGPVRISDFMFKNTNAGQNTKVVIDGTVLSDRQRIQMGLVG